MMNIVTYRLHWREERTLGVFAGRTSPNKDVLASATNDQEAVTAAMTLWRTLKVRERTEQTNKYLTPRIFKTVEVEVDGSGVNWASADKKKLRVRSNTKGTSR